MTMKRPELLTLKTTFVTFYSFKGGVGRSMALINVASILASRRGFRVLVIDLDLEAPGLSYLNPHASSDEDSPAPTAQDYLSTPGFIDLITDAVENGEDGDLFKLNSQELEQKYTRPIPTPDAPEEAGELLLMPSGRLDTEYSTRLDRLNLNALYHEGFGEPLIRAFKQKLQDSRRYDFVLIDSRTGLSDVAGICTRDLADHVVLLTGLNRQNVLGTAAFLEQFRRATSSNIPIQIVLSPMPNGEDNLLEKRRAIASQQFQTAWGGPVNIDLEIPYHPRLALTEEPHVLRFQRGSLYDAYHKLESSILDACGFDADSFSIAALKSLETNDVTEAIRRLRLMVRLNHGLLGLSKFFNHLRANASLPADWRSRFILNINELEKSNDWVLLLNFCIDTIVKNDADYLLAILPKLLSTWNDVAHRFIKHLKDSAKRADELVPLATVLIQGKFYPEAVQIVQKQFELSDQSAEYASFLAFTKFKNGEVDFAEATFKDLLVSGAHIQTIRRHYARMLWEEGRLCESALEYERLLSNEPVDSKDLISCGQVYIALDRNDEGIELLRRGYATCPVNNYQNLSEAALVFWLCSVVWERSRLIQSAWEGHYKFLLRSRFPRQLFEHWFEPLLSAAKAKTPPSDQRYAELLVAAFNDDSKASDLEQLPRWRALNPIAPKLDLTNIPLPPTPAVDLSPD